jgi:hypothetical protein
MTIANFNKNITLIGGVINETIEIRCNMRGCSRGKKLSTIWLSNVNLSCRSYIIIIILMPAIFDNMTWLLSDLTVNRRRITMIRR